MRGESSWFWIFCLLGIAVIVVIGSCAARRAQTPIVTVENLPDDLPACSPDLNWQTGKLLSSGLYPDVVIVCLQSREGIYEWHRLIVQPIR